MTTDDPRRALRGAVYRADGVAVLAELERVDPTECLQLAGDGLVVALGQELPGATESAGPWVARLRERGWRGDADLADQIEARLGTRPAPMLRPLRVDLDELSDVLEGDPRQGGGRIDLRSGEVWPQFVDLDEIDEQDEDESRWLPVWSEGSRAGYRDMCDFVETMPDPDRRERLEIALEGRGAFRRFRDVLDRWPEEVDRWRPFSDERRTGRARAWLVDAGYQVVPPRYPRA